MDANRYSTAGEIENDNRQWTRGIRRSGLGTCGWNDWVGGTGFEAGRMDTEEVNRCCGGRSETGGRRYTERSDGGCEKSWRLIEDERKKRNSKIYPQKIITFLVYFPVKIKTRLRIVLFDTRLSDVISVVQNWKNTCTLTRTYKVNYYILLCQWRTQDFPMEGWSWK